VLVLMQEGQAAVLPVLLVVLLSRWKICSKFWLVWE
jgi:hypothetical protein